MEKIIFDSGISLDGFFAGDNRGPSNPMGGVSGKIHNWMFNQKAFWEYLGIEGGKEDGPDGGFIRKTITRTEAFIMGKRMFEEGEVSWPEDLYKANVYVLTHEEREPWVQKGSTTFYFINDGIHSALEKAKQSAKGKDIRIQGGAPKCPFSSCDRNNNPISHIAFFGFSLLKFPRAIEFFNPAFRFGFNFK